MNKLGNILVVDDEPSMRESLSMLLKEKYRVATAPDGKSALTTIEKEPFDLVLLDMRLPEVDGLTVLRQIKEIDQTIDVIMITAVKTVANAVEAMRRGAYDYITKPFDIEALESLVGKVMEKRALERENKFLKSSAKPSEELIGQCPAMKEVMQTVRDIAESDITVLLTGESGTGKEVVARQIHLQSPRRNHLFVPINCAAIPETLIESELFGHEKGSFTGAFERHLGKFELADRGTLFLDEIGSLPLAMQGKLLRVLQEKKVERVGGQSEIPVDVRIVAATNIPLDELIQKGRFREDLYYRLNVVPIKLPPLRERSNDLKLLLEHFLKNANTKFRKTCKGFSAEALPLLQNYDWPGNVRELENLIERLVVLTKEEWIGREHLPPEFTKGSFSTLTNVAEDLPLKDALARFELGFIEQALKKAGGSKNKAAKMLGIHRNTLLQIEKKFKKSDDPSVD